MGSVCVFVFFKQKTAYELRISDWSSDVCSSDLAGDALYLLRGVVLDLLADLVHRIDALGDKFLVLPSVLEDVPEHSPEHRDVGPGADPHIFGRMCGRPGEARIDHDEVRVIELLEIGRAHV